MELSINRLYCRDKPHYFCILTEKTYMRQKFAIFIISTFTAAACGVLSKKTSSTPIISKKTISKANPIDSTGRESAVALSSGKGLKSTFKKNGGKSIAQVTPSQDTSIPVSGDSWGLPAGVSISHVYLNVAGFAFYGAATPTDTEISTLSDRLGFIRTNIAVEKMEAQRNVGNDYVLNKYAIDMAAEEKLLHDQNPNILSSGSFIYDIVGKSFDFGALTLVDGTYQRFELLLTRSRTVEQNSFFYGHSLILLGTYNDGTNNVPLSITSNAPLVIRVDITQNKLIVKQNIASSLNLNFDPSVWFKNISMAGLTRDQDGGVRIADYVNSDALNSFELNIISSLIAGSQNIGVAGDSADSAKQVNQEFISANQQLPTDAAPPNLDAPRRDQSITAGSATRLPSGGALNLDRFTTFL